jgi:hypothetical protein
LLKFHDFFEAAEMDFEGWNNYSALECQTETGTTVLEMAPNLTAVLKVWFFKSHNHSPKIGSKNGFSYITVVLKK